MQPHVLLDLDDTCILTSQLYRTARQQARSLIHDLLAVPEGRIEALIERLDVERARYLGFARERFPDTLVQVYEICCTIRDTEPSEHAAEAIYAIGDRVFETVAPVIPGTDEALWTLAETHSIVLVTKGDRAVQERRIIDSGLSGYFSGVEIVPTKTPDVYKQVCANYGVLPGDIWMIGDSLASDINPAVAAGLTGIHITGRDTWALEQAAPSGPYWQAADLAEAVQIVQGTDRATREALLANLSV